MGWPSRTAAAAMEGSQPESRRQAVHAAGDGAGEVTQVQKTE